MLRLIEMITLQDLENIWISILILKVKELTFSANLMATHINIMKGLIWFPLEIRFKI